MKRESYLNNPENRKYCAMTMVPSHQKIFKRSYVNSMIIPNRS